MSGGEEHLTPQQVLRLLALVQECNAVVVGGQAINLWARYYLPRVPALSDCAPFTSKDLDFYGTRRNAEHLAQALDGDLYLPSLGDSTPNAAVVVATLEDRRIQVDFLAMVLGVEDRALKDDYVVLEGREPTSGEPLKLVLLHPLDCLRSRLANVDVLGRHDAHSVRQARASVLIVGAFLDELLALGEQRLAQSVLRDLFFVARDHCLGKPSQLRHGLDPGATLKDFREDPRLDSRWRTKTLETWIRKLEAKATHLANALPASPPRKPRS